MSKVAIFDSVSRQLKAFGYVESDDPLDIVVEVDSVPPNAIIDEFMVITGPSLATRRSLAIKACKEAATLWIVGKLPIWKQINFLALAVSLVDRRDTDPPLTTEQEEQLSYVRSLWSWVQSVRYASDAIEAQINASDEPESVPLVFPSLT